MKKDENPKPKHRSLWLAGLMRFQGHRRVKPSFSDLFSLYGEKDRKRRDGEAYASFQGQVCYNQRQWMGNLDIFPVWYDTRMNKEEANSFARKAVALCYYVQKDVSLGYCAEIAWMSKERFIRYLNENNISIFHYDDEQEFVKELNNA